MISKKELEKAYVGLENEKLIRSEHLSHILMDKYDFKPTNAWFNVYSLSLCINLGNRTVLAPVGTEIVFFTKTTDYDDNGSPVDVWDLVGVGVIENRPGFMKFTPIYLYSQYDGHGAHAGQTVRAFINGFEFYPGIEVLGFGQSVKLNELKSEEEF